MKFELKIGEKNFEIEILETEKGTKVRVGNKEFLFEEKLERKGPSQIVIPKRDFSKLEVLAPISGEVSEVLVKEGDFVEKDTPLLIISAMKMENEILAEKEGRVMKIFVKKGQKVKKDEKLLELQ